MTVAAISAPVRTRLERLSQAFAALTAVSLPWSTSVTSVCVALWIVTLLPLIEWRSFSDAVRVPAAWLPLALLALAVVGVLWADVPWRDRFLGVAPFAKLAVVPLLMWQFSRQERGERIFYAFLASGCALLALSWLSAAYPQLLPWRDTGRYFGIPVKDYISQSGVFTLCIFGVLQRAFAIWPRARIGAVLLVALAGLFLANIVFVALARTALVVIVVLFVLFGLRYATGKGLAVLSAAFVALAALSWTTSDYLRWRVENIAGEIQNFTPEHDTSSGARLAFWKDSIAIVRDAPLLGHGTGSIRASFAKQTGVDATSPGAATNPHNQVLAVAIQLGGLGALVLIAMWIAHAGLFLARDAASWIGLIVVVQNVISSLFNSHLFDFTPGWIYVFGAGVAGGLVLRNRRPAPP